MRAHFQEGIAARGLTLHQAWWAVFERYRQHYPELADQGYSMLRRELPIGSDGGWPAFPADTKGIATRDASGQALNALAKQVPWLLGGSTDLGPSCKTRLIFEGAGDFQNPAGRNLHYGIREHAMGAILNGLSLSKIRPSSPSHLLFRCKQESIVEPIVAPEHLRPDEEGRRTEDALGTGLLRLVAEPRLAMLAAFQPNNNFFVDGDGRGELARRILFLDDLRRPHGQAPMSLLSFRVFPIN